LQPFVTGQILFGKEQRTWQLNLAGGKPLHKWTGASSGVQSLGHEPVLAGRDFLQRYLSITGIPYPSPPPSPFAPRVTDCEVIFPTLATDCWIREGRKTQQAGRPSCLAITSSFHRRRGQGFPPNPVTFPLQLRWRLSDPHGAVCSVASEPPPLLRTMGSKNSRSTSPAPRVVPIDPKTSPSSPSADIAAFKAKIDDIERRRCEASTVMRDRLHAAVVEYKRADQSFVNEHTACLNELLAAFPEAGNLDWAQPCLGVPDRELFARDGIAIKYHPSFDPAGFGALARGLSPSPSTHEMIGSLLAPSPFSSTLSSAPPSPRLPDMERPTPKPTPHHESAPPLVPSKRSASRPAKRSSSVASSSSSSIVSNTPPSPDELTPDAKPPRPQPRKRSRSMHAPPATTATGRKLLPTSRRGHYTANSTTRQLAPTAASIKPPAEKRVYQGGYQGRYKCAECSKSSQKCDRGLPCSVCVRKGKAEQCQYSTRRRR